MNRRVVTFLQLAAILVGTTARAGTAASPPLYWKSAPQSGGRVLLDTGQSGELHVTAASRNPQDLVTVSLLGRTPVRIVGRPGNPARATLRFPTPRSFRPRTFVVTLVARAMKSPLAITRTVIVEIRPSKITLTGPGARSRWAYVLQATSARARPAFGARTVASMPTATADSTPNLVSVLAETRLRQGSQWVAVALTTLPNGRTGWVQRRTLSQFHSTDVRAVVDTGRLTLTLYRGDRRLLRVSVAVGRSRWPTPHGTFYVRDRLTHFSSPFYGPVAFGTNARSPTLTDWPSGGIVGIHGTNRPDLIPGRVSHGCIRLRNADILRVARYLPLGARVIIR